MRSALAQAPSRSFAPKLPALAAAGMVVAALVAVSAARLGAAGIHVALFIDPDAVPRGNVFARHQRYQDR